jgi:hypothetical protein
LDTVVRTITCDFSPQVLFVIENLDTASILDGLRMERFYSTMGPKVYDVHLEGNHVTVRCSPARSVFLIGDIWHCPHAIQSWDGQLLTEATFTLHASQRYFRIEVVDERCQSAWTNAYPIAYSQ